MESLNASLLNVVLKIREGSGFGFLTSPFVIVCNLNGNVLTSDPIPCCANPTFESDFVWEAEKKFLRSMRSNNYSIRVEFFSDAKHKRHDKIGYILLNMKQQAQIVSPKLGKHVSYNWHKLLGVRNDAKSCKPEILLSLFIKEADFELGSKTPKTPPPTESVTAGAPAVEVPTMESAGQDAVVPTERSAAGEREVQVGSPRDSDSHFKLQVRITSAFNLASLVSDEMGGVGGGRGELRLEFALFGECHRTADLSTSQGPLLSEYITLHIRAQLHSLVAYFSEFPSLYFLVQTDGHTISKAPFDMKRLMTLEKCQELTSGRMSELREETKLFPDNQTDGSSSYFTVQITLQHERTKVNNPIKPFTISSQHKKGEKAEVRGTGGGNKIQIKGVHCKTKNNSAADTDCKADDCSNQPLTNLNKQPQINTSSLEAESQQINIHSNTAVANDCNLPADRFPHLMNHHKDLNEMQSNQQRCMNNFTEVQNFNPPPQNMNQFVYPYFQQAFPYPQDGRGDLYGGAGHAQPEVTATLADSVKAKITDELARKTYDELEDWKEKQKENYKTDLKKKLEKEVKRLTAEWLSRQNELEREATSNIEESVLLSQQLHCTSSELKVRLEAVNKQQIELEKEREGLDKKYAERHQQMKETSKQQQTVLQQQVTSLKGEVEELRTKICSLMKENEMLRCLQPGQQMDGHAAANTQQQQQLMTMSGKVVSSKSTHLTEQQMTALLVDMKSLEEKLSAAVESKEFFRKEWSRALREIHRMKTEQEQQVRLQLQAQRQELDNLRLVGLIASDDKSSKDDLASIRDLKSQIVRLNTPKSS